MIISRVISKTGRARCQYCAKQIPKGTACVEMRAYHSSGEKLCFSCVLMTIFGIQPEKARQQMITALALQEERFCK